MSLQDKAYYMSLQDKECDFTYNFLNSLIAFFILLMYLNLGFIIVVISWQKVISFLVLINVKVLPAYNLFQMSTLCQCFHHQNLTTLSANYVNCCVRRKINLCSNHLSDTRMSTSHEIFRSPAEGKSRDCRSTSYGPVTPRSAKRWDIFICPLLSIDSLGTYGC